MNHTDKTWVVNDLDPNKIETYAKHISWRRKIADTRSPGDAKRIVYCVNALKGVESPRDFVQNAKSNARTVTLQETHINKLDSEIKALNHEKQELLEVLKSIQSLTDGGATITKDSVITFAIRTHLIGK